MIFQISNKEIPFDMITLNIIAHISIKNFLKRKFNYEKTLLCPTNAIDIDEKVITNKCIDCGLCWAKNKNIISKLYPIADFKVFKNFLLKNKMFFYKWVSIILNEYSGIEIKSLGYSRTKRIPFVIIKNNIIYFAKIIKEEADTDKAEYQLEEYINLIHQEIKKYKPIKMIIILEKTRILFYSGEKIILPLKNIYDKVIKKGELKLEDIIEGEFFNK